MNIPWIVALSLLAFGIRVAKLGASSLWLDEAVTADVASGSFANALFSEPQHPPLYYLSMWCVVQLFGPSEVALRLPSAVVGTLQVPVTAWLTRCLAPRVPRVAITAAALTAISPFFVHLSRDARSYALVMLLASLAHVAFLAWANRPQHRTLLAYVFCATALIHTHYLGTLALLAHDAVLLTVPALRAKRSWWLARAVLGLAFVPWLAFAVRHASVAAIAWVPPFPVSAMHALLRMLGGWGIAVPARSPLQVLLEVALAAAVLAPGAWLLWRGIHSFPHGIGRRLVFATLAVPLLVLGLLSPVVSLLHDRSVAFVATSLVLLMGAGAHELAVASARLRRAMAVAAALLGLALYGARFVKERWRDAARVTAETAPDDVVVSPSFLEIPLRHYAPSLHIHYGSQVRDDALCGENGRRRAYVFSHETRDDGALRERVSQKCHVVARHDFRGYDDIAVVIVEETDTSHSP